MSRALDRTQVRDLRQGCTRRAGLPRVPPTDKSASMFRKCNSNPQGFRACSARKGRGHLRSRTPRGNRLWECRRLEAHAHLRPTFATSLGLQHTRLNTEPRGKTTHGACPTSIAGYVGGIRPECRLPPCAGTFIATGMSSSPVPCERLSIQLIRCVVAVLSMK